MPIDQETLLSTVVDDLPVSYSARDAMLYALGIGIGSDPCDRNQLAYVTEHGAQRTVPTMASMLVAAEWLDDCGWAASCCTPTSAWNSTGRCRRRRACWSTTGSRTCPTSANGAAPGS